jgi:Family of unknown function (DUF5946)
MPASGRSYDRKFHASAECWSLFEEVPPLLQRLARRTSWPHLAPPERTGHLTVCDVALADSPQTHAARVREWAGEVWRDWSPHRGIARELAESLERA